MTEKETSVIPKQWRTAVCAILDAHDASRIVLTQRAQRDWEATFPLSFRFELYRAMSKALSNDAIEGRQVVGMTPPGEVWEFFFEHERRRLYGKINLLPDGRMIIVYSAHVPLKGEAL